MGKQSPFRVFLIVIWIMTVVFLSACGGDYAVVPVAETPFPACAGQDIINPYSNSSVEDAVKLYQFFLDKQGDVIQTDQYRKEAFLRLAEQVQFESATHVLFQDENQTVLATITLLSPNIVQYAILNQLMFNVSSHNMIVNPDDPEYSVPAVQKRLESAMGDLAGRQELLFLITVAYPPDDPFAPSNNDLSVKIQFEKIHMISASHKSIPARHNNPDLNALTAQESEMKTGLFGFALGMRISDECKPLLDQWDTNITIEAMDILVGDAKVDSIMWTIPYYPLIQDDFTHYGAPLYHQNNYGGLNLVIESVPTPPTAIKNGNNGANTWQEYWWQMSQYVWHVIVTLSHDEPVNPLQ